MATMRFVTRCFCFPTLLFGIAALGFVGQAQAQVFVLDFEGLGDLEPVAQFYNGGTGGGSPGSTGGSNFGVDFNADALALIDFDAGGSGLFANEPSPDTVLFFLSGAGALMNVAAGFTTGFSFFYTSVTVAGFVTVWDGLNATGNMLAMIDLPFLGTAGNGDPGGAFDTWVAVGVAFVGTALSIDFGGAADQIGYDDVTFGSATPGTPGSATSGTPVPEPSSLLLLGLGLSCWSLVSSHPKSGVFRAVFY